MSDSNVKTLIDKLIDWINDKKGNNGGTLSTVLGLIAAGIAFLTVAYLSWRARRQGKKLAKLLHERDLKAQEKINIEETVKVVKNASRAASLRDKVVDAEVALGVLDSKIKQLKEARNKDVKRIKDLKNWDDVDDFIDQQRGSS